jgi:Zn-dependent M28 family amino/carboxypeptidase
MDTTTTPPVAERTLREVVETLAPLDRTACSPGEREAAQWLAKRLLAAGCASAELEEEPSWGPFPPTVLGLAALGVAGAALTLRGRRVAGIATAAASLLGVMDEVQNGPRVVRRAVRRRQTTVNVVAETGDPRAERTLVVLAHHDAPQTGRFFDQTWQRTAYELAPEFIGGLKTPPPQWWIGAAVPALTAAGAATGRRRPLRAALALGLLGTLALADIARSPTVPGANDNLSGVAGLVALAELVREAPIPGVRLLLVSCGAEETLQDGMRGFLARHRGRLDPARTWFLNLETVGSPHLGLMEAEGPMWMEEYAGPGFRDAVARSAERIGVAMERGLRARASTDSIIPSRAGYPTATLTSTTPWRALANYHLMSDTPENLDYGTVVAATRVAYAVAEAVAAGEA